MIGEQGHADDALRGAVLLDISPCLCVWSAKIVRIFTCTSGSIHSQRLICGDSVDGDHSSLIARFSGTRIAAKRDPDTHPRLAISINVPMASATFLSDVEAKLNATTTAGMPACRIVRPGTDTSRQTAIPSSATSPPRHSFSACRAANRASHPGPLVPHRAMGDDAGLELGVCG